MFAIKDNRKEKLFKPWRVVFAFIATVICCGILGLVSLYLATSTYSVEMFVSYLKNPYILLLNMAPPLILSVLFFLLFNRAVWSFLATTLLVAVPTVIHYYKLALRGDALIFADMSLALESAKMLESYDLFMDMRLWTGLGIFAFCTLFLALFAKGRFKRKAPRLTSAVCILLASLLLVPAYTSDDIYNTKTENVSLINRWSDNQQYISKGFVYPFLHSVKSSFSPAPEGYNEEEAKEILSSYTDEIIPADKQINIVCVMLEAYTDLSRFESLRFTEDVFAKYHELEKIGYSGRLITDIFAGDTKVSEREFLTGYPYARLDDFVSKSNSYVWYLRSNGYETTGSHPSYAWFYNRQNINKNLGFESYLFSENYYKEITEVDITYDMKFFPLLRDLYLERDRSRPYFSFSINYQGHGPYETNTENYPYPYLENPGVSLTDERMINNYLNSIKGTTEHLYTFANDMLATEEPLVLVFFGDHLPSMDIGGRVLSAYGVNLDTSTNEGFENYYGTQYLIIANDAAKKISGNSFVGKGETISVAFLMNKVFELCGYKGSAYMQFTSDIASRTPVIHRYDDMSEGDRRLFDCVSYYYRKNFSYN